MIKINKKGLSEVISVVLLILVSLALATIIFLWARSFFDGNLEKNGMPVAQACEEIKISAQKYSSGIDITNKGNIPIAGISLKKVGKGISTVENYPFEKEISAGGILSLETSVDYDKIIAIPVILAKLGEETKLYTCKEEFGVVVYDSS